MNWTDKINFLSFLVSVINHFCRVPCLRWNMITRANCSCRQDSRKKSVCITCLPA